MPAQDDLFSGAPAPDDPLELLYSRRLSFAGGEPLITVRVLEGRHQIVVSPRGPLTALARTDSGESRTAVSEGVAGRWTLQLLETAPGAGAAWVELEQLRYDDKNGLQKARDEQPHLIMFGFDLFDMSGPDFCRQIRADEQTRAISLLFTTSDSANAPRLFPGPYGRKPNTSSPTDTSVTAGPTASTVPEKS